MKEPISILESLGRWQAVNPKDEERVATFGMQQAELNHIDDEVEEYEFDSPANDLKEEVEEIEDLSTEKASTSD